MTPLDSSVHSELPVLGARRGPRWRALGSGRQEGTSLARAPGSLCWLCVCQFGIPSPPLCLNPPACLGCAVGAGRGEVSLELGSLGPQLPRLGKQSERPPPRKGALCQASTEGRAPRKQTGTCGLLNGLQCSRGLEPRGLGPSLHPSYKHGLAGKEAPTDTSQRSGTTSPTGSHARGALASPEDLLTHGLWAPRSSRWLRLRICTSGKSPGVRGPHFENHRRQLPPGQTAPWYPPLIAAASSGDPRPGWHPDLSLRGQQKGREVCDGVPSACFPRGLELCYLGLVFSVVATFTRARVSGGRGRAVLGTAPACSTRLGAWQVLNQYW